VKIPEQGQMVCVRNRYFIVTDVEPYDSVDQSVILHKVALECLDDDLMGEEMELIWELELDNNKKVIDAIELPRPEKNQFDSWRTFRAFIDAIKLPIHLCRTCGQHYFKVSTDQFWICLRVHKIWYSI